MGGAVWPHPIIPSLQLRERGMGWQPFYIAFTIIVAVRSFLPYNGGGKPSGRESIMVVRRDRMEIASDILDICKKGANKTRIVYQANLNFKTVNIYIDLLTEKGLIEVDLSTPSKLYRTTEKGSSLLEDIKWIRDVLRG